MKLKFIIFTILFFVLFQGKADAFNNSSATLAFSIEAKVNDARVKKLRSYLEVNNSPLASSAHVFVEAADKYNLDWKLVAAISGLESGFGKHIPTSSYNAWGWGVYGDNVIYFDSWKSGIKTLSQGIREKYMDRWGAQNIYEIGSIYAASPTWAQRVEMFMGKIENYTTLDPSDSLSIAV